MTNWCGLEGVELLLVVYFNYVVLVAESLTWLVDRNTVKIGALSLRCRCDVLELVV